MLPTRSERRRLSVLVAATLAVTILFTVLLTVHATASGSDVGATAAGRATAAAPPAPAVRPPADHAVPSDPAAPRRSAVPPGSAGAPGPAGAPADVAAQVTDAVEAVVPGTVSAFALLDRRTGRTLSGGTTDTLYTASVVKVLIALDVLRSAGGQVPDGPTTDAVARMLSASDDAIASDLWDRQGRTAVVTRTAAEIGLADTVPPDDDEQWELTRMSARDVVAVYRFVLDRAGQAERDFLMGALRAATPRGSDGFGQYFGIPNGLPGTGWAIKQGWMYTTRSLVLNTTGVVGDRDRYVVALLTAQPEDTGYDTGRSAVTAGIAALRPSLTGTAST